MFRTSPGPGSPAERVYVTYAAVTELAMATFGTLSAVYRIQVAGLDPLQLVLVGTVLEASVFLFEVPTGVVADTSAGACP